MVDYAVPAIRDGDAVVDQALDPAADLSPLAAAARQAGLDEPEIARTLDSARKTSQARNHQAELGPAEAGRQLELLVMRGPLELRLVLATLQDVRLGLHQLRLETSPCSAQELTAPDTEQSSHRPRVP